MNQKKSDFNKVFSAWDILVIAFGAMIGWGWVVSSGGWIEEGGAVGAAIGYVGVSCFEACAFPTILTVIIGGAGILLIVTSVINGDVSNLSGQAFVGSSGGSIVKSILGVAVITPFYFIGFDVIPQAAEEIDVPLKKKR